MNPKVTFQLKRIGTGVCTVGTLKWPLTGVAPINIKEYMLCFSSKMKALLVRTKSSKSSFKKAKIKLFQSPSVLLSLGNSILNLFNMEELDARCSCSFTSCDV